jgi:hypothetical protein
VFNNVLADPSFGVTSRIFLSQLTPSGLRPQRPAGRDRLGGRESFRTVQTARFAEVIRAVSFTPGTR